MDGYQPIELQQGAMKDLPGQKILKWSIGVAR